MPASKEEEEEEEEQYNDIILITSVGLDSTQAALSSRKGLESGS